MSEPANRQQQLFAQDPDPWEVDDQAELQAARIVFAEAPFGPYDYAVSEQLRGRVRPGLRVKVPLGRQNRLVVGYCVGLGLRSSNAKRLKNIKELVDQQPLLLPNMMRWLTGCRITICASWARCWKLWCPPACEGKPARAK